MSLTGQGLADFAKEKVGTPYFYGAKWNVLTEDYMAKMHSYYPKVVTTSYMQKARSKGQIGVKNVDCSGLIFGYRNKNLGSSQLYSTAKKRLPISEINDFAVGTVLWKSGHVGVYIGDGKCIEAKGINYGVVCTDVSSQAWKYGLTFEDMDYTYETKVEGTSKGENPYVEPISIVTSMSNALLKGCKSYVRKGNSVRWVQWELVEAGFDLQIDGVCGKLTLQAITDFQRSSKLTVDGLCGENTRAALKAN